MPLRRLVASNSMLYALATPMIATLVVFGDRYGV